MCTDKVPVLLASSTTIVSVASEVAWTDIHVLRIARPTTRHKKRINPSPHWLPLTCYPSHLPSPPNLEIVITVGRLTLAKQKVTHVRQKIILPVVGQMSRHC